MRQNSGVKEDFPAKVKPIQTFYMADVARLIAEERTEYRIDTIVNITKLVEAKIRQLACGNNIVVTDTATLRSAVLTSVSKPSPVPSALTLRIFEPVTSRMPPGVTVPSHSQTI